MLSVLRTLAVVMPTDEQVQLTFAESLEANQRGAVAEEVYRRMLRRGVSDLGVLARVKAKLGEPDGGAAESGGAALAALEAEVAADPENAADHLRLARAYYYSLRIDEALETAKSVEKTAPHLEGLHDLIIEIYTLRDDREHLIEALKARIERAGDEDERRSARTRLVEELLAAGRTGDAIEEIRKLPDPRDPESYSAAARWLHYFGRHDEALEQLTLGDRSQSHQYGYGYSGGDEAVGLTRSAALKGDLARAADELLKSVDEQNRQASQYSGMLGLLASYMDTEQNVFRSFKSLFALYPDLMEDVRQRLVKRHEEKPDDGGAAKLLMQFHRTVSRPDLAEAMLDRLAEKGATDQALVSGIIDRAIRRRDYARAIALAEQFIAQQPKPQPPPGLPPQFAGAITACRRATSCSASSATSTGRWSSRNRRLSNTARSSTRTWNSRSLPTPPSAPCAGASTRPGSASIAPWKSRR